ncbi:MAG: hypothetical protein ACPG8W_05325 [Candidatus Promineifilaceae bacterium]
MFKKLFGNFFQSSTPEKKPTPSVKQPPKAPPPPVKKVPIVLPKYNPYPHKDKVALQIKELYDEGYMKKICSLLEAMDGGDEWNRRTDYLHYLGTIADREMVEQAPDTATGEQIRGYHAIEWAWQARGGGTADTVEDGGWAKFYNRLELAQEHLLNAASLDTNDPCSYPALISTQQGTGDPVNPLVQSYFDEGMSRYPCLVDLHRQNMGRLVKKWGGSHDLARQSAQVAVDAATPRHPVAGMWFAALIEEWFYHKSFSDADDHLEVARQFRLDKDRRKEAIAIYARIAGHADNTAVSEINELWEISIHNSIGAWFYLSNVEKILAHELKLLDGRIKQVPWVWIKPASVTTYEGIIRNAYKQARLIT